MQWATLFTSFFLNHLEHVYMDPHCHQRGHLGDHPKPPPTRRSNKIDSTGLGQELSSMRYLGEADRRSGWVGWAQKKPSFPHRIHGTGIFTYNWHEFMVNGKEIYHTWILWVREGGKHETHRPQVRVARAFSKRGGIGLVTKRVHPRNLT